MMTFTDSHCHLDFPELASDISQLLTQCAAHNIHQILIPSVSPKNWQRVLSFSANKSHSISIYTAIGIHPWYLTGLNQQTLDNFDAFFEQHSNAIDAIGETGLDGKIWQEQNNKEQQQLFFRHHIAIANKYKKPLIVHHRRSHNEVIEILKNENAVYGGILHAFSGSYQQGKTYIDLGFKLGIGGTITYERAEKTRKAIKRFPLDALLLETDAPAMPLASQQGQTNSPVNIIKIFESLKTLRTETPMQISTQIEHNFRALFPI